MILTQTRVLWLKVGQWFTLKNDVNATQYYCTAITPVSNGCVRITIKGSEKTQTFTYHQDHVIYKVNKG